MGNSLLTIFDEIWSKSLYCSTGTLAPNFDLNQLKLSTQHKYMYMYMYNCFKMMNWVLDLMSLKLISIWSVWSLRTYKQVQ